VPLTAVAASTEGTVIGTFKRPLTLADLWRDPVNFLALGFGSGLAPVAPGTFGTLVALPVYWWLALLPLEIYVAGVVAASLLGIWICARASRSLQTDDHPGVVWDEICGYLIAMCAVPRTWHWMLAGFVLFRVFDIWKPWPIRAADRKVGGGLGVMLDDIIAGLFTWIVLQIAMRVVL
jgi:phosphatidylglycerophosphatase A